MTGRAGGRIEQTNSGTAVAGSGTEPRADARGRAAIALRIEDLEGAEL
jgi:hypothetical protein